MLVNWKPLSPFLNFSLRVYEKRVLLFCSGVLYVCVFEYYLLSNLNTDINRRSSCNFKMGLMVDDTISLAFFDYSLLNSSYWKNFWTPEDDANNLFCSWSTSYEDLLSTNEPFPEPIPLTVSFSFSFSEKIVVRVSHVESGFMIFCYDFFVVLWI